MSARYTAMFAPGKPVAIPFMMLGDPDPDTSLARIEALVAAGADALELGFPFSDPVADGPALVAAANRARAAGVRPDDCFAIIAELRARHPALPIGVLVYVNLLLARGLDEFYARAARAGLDSVLVPDLPLEESARFRAAAGAFGVAQVFIAPPDADDRILAEVARATRGYTYVLGRRGVTGGGGADFAPVTRIVATLNAAGAPPSVVGFGIDGPAAARAAVATGAAGVIVGSALVDAFVRGGVGVRTFTAIRQVLT